jgi:hypothetical protein
LTGSTAREAPSTLERGSTKEESRVPSRVERTRSVNGVELRRAISCVLSDLKASWDTYCPAGAVNSLTQVKLYPVASNKPMNTLLEADTMLRSVLDPPTPMLPNPSVSMVLMNEFPALDPIIMGNLLCKHSRGPAYMASICANVRPPSTLAAVPTYSRRMSSMTKLVVPPVDTANTWL